MHNFTFNGTSLSNFGGRLLQPPFHTIAARNKTFEKIYGQSGDEIIDNESYNNVSFSLKICFFPMIAQQTARVLAYSIIDWLAPLQNAYYTYSDTVNPNYFTKAVITNFDEIKRDLPTLLTATLKFSRVPFWFRSGGAATITFTDQALLTNPEQYTAEQIMTLTYTGEGTLNNIQMLINGNSTIFDASAAAPTQLFDNVTKQHYRIENGSKVYLSAKLPVNLSPGDNLINFSTSRISCSIVPNWRRL